MDDQKENQTYPKLSPQRNRFKLLNTYNVLTDDVANTNGAN